MPNVVLNTRIQVRNDTAANWSSTNPILLYGEIGIERVTNKFKFGDGSSQWNSLPYASTNFTVVAANYPQTSDYGHEVGTVWIGTISSVTKIYILTAVVGSTAVWKQLITPEDLSDLGAGDMMKDTYAPIASVTTGKEDYVDKALLADKVANKLTIGSVEFDGSSTKTISSLPPSGNAGGDLTGTYPNPTIKSSVVLTGNPLATTQNITDESTKIATTAYVKAKIDQLMSASNAFQFKGTLGTGGTITALPTTYSVGWTYKVITAGTYAGQTCEVNDQIIAVTARTGSDNLNADWTIIQGNLDGAVTTTATLTSNSVVLGDGNHSVKTLTNGAESYLLKIVSGIPTWAAETAYSGTAGIQIVAGAIGHTNSITAVVTAGLFKFTYNAQGHITSATAVTKTDITDLGIPGEDTGITSVVANNGISQAITDRQLTLGLSSISSDLLTNGVNVLVISGGNA